MCVCAFKDFGAWWVPGLSGLGWFRVGLLRAWAVCEFRVCKFGGSGVCVQGVASLGFCMDPKPNIHLSIHLSSKGGVKEGRYRN